MQRRPEPLDGSDATQRMGTQQGEPAPDDASAQPTEHLAHAGAESQLLALPDIARPTMEPGGGLTTSIAAQERATQVASVARAAQDRAQRDVALVARSLADIAAVLHEHAGRLEHYVEGSYSTDLADPRTRMLSQSLAIARQADLHLARLGQSVGRLGASVQAAHSTLEALRHERERLSTLYHIAQELNSALDLDDLLARVMSQLIDVVRAERGYLMLWDDTAARLRFAAARGSDGHSLHEDDFGLSAGVVDRVWHTQEPLLTVDAQEDARLRERVSIVAYGIRSVMCAPLRVRGHAVGIVYVDSRNQAALFDATHLDLLAAFCNQAAIAIDNARLFADLRHRIQEISAMKSYTDSIFASIASGVVTADTLGSITAFNRAAERIFGLAGELAVGRPYSEVLAGLGGTELSELMRRAVVKREVTLGREMARMLPEGGEVCLRLNVSPLRAGDGEGEAMGVAMVVDDLTELRHSQRQAEEIQRLFGRYVHPAVVRQLLADPAAVNLGGETREISVVFADIRGYTRLAEGRAPGEVVRILNQYLDILTAAIWREEGTLTMFIGDALMAIFNAPLPQPDHALRAVRAAWAMRRALERHSDSLGPGAPPVEYGIGVHTGDAVVGNIGAADRLQNYTAIGDAVNTAQRLQAAASANQILLSATTYMDVMQHAHAHELPPMTLKGKTRPLSVYQLDGLR